MKKIAITGGAGEGKSTVLGYCREAGFDVASSDDIARGLYDRPEVQLELARMLNESLPVSRQTLLEAITRDPGLRRAVNRLMHPLIVRALGETSAAFVEVPLLIEACLTDQFDRIWVVTCGTAEQLRRLSSRLGNEDAAQRLMATQLPTAAKLPFADFIIRTNLSKGSVQANVLQAAKNEL